jgi:predicted Zn finger-like uncharacterized protein
MSFRITCPKCAARYTLGPEFAGQTVRCRNCSEVFTATASEPLPAQPVAAVPVATDALQTRPGSVPPPVPARPGAPPLPPRARRAEPVDPERSPVVWIIIGVSAVVLFLVAAGVTFVMLRHRTEAAAQADQERDAQAVNVQVGNFAAGRQGAQPNAIEKAPPMRFDPVPPVPPAPPIVVPPPPAVVIRAPEPEGEKVVRPLPAPVADVAVGGNGRYLVLHLPTRRELAVFDVNEAKLVKALTAPAEKIVFAAGMDKLVAVEIDTGKVHRWSLTTFEHEAEGQLGMKVPPVAAAMGSASNGPLVVSCVNWPVLGETVFFDVLTMKRLETGMNAHGIFQTSPTVFLRASADGRLFTCEQSANSGNIQLCSLDNGHVEYSAGGRGQSPIPSPDGQVIYTVGGLQMPDFHPIAGLDAACLPAHHGPYWLSVPRPPGPRAEGQPADVSVHLAGNGVFARLTDLEGAEGAEPGDRTRLPLDRRLHFIPDAKVFVTIPAGNDRLVLRKFDPEAVLVKSDLDFLLFTSRPPASAAKGATYTYPVRTKSRNGGVRPKLEVSPPGMALDENGKLTWAVPADFADAEVLVRVSATSDSGQFASQSFRIGIVAGERK